MGKKSFIFSLFLTCLFLSIFSAAFPLVSKKDTQETKLNLLLITIDTLRSDRLSCYSTEHLKTPNIDGLAEKGILFLKAFAHTPTTLPSHTNILLGLTPLYHGVHENINFVVRDEFLTLAEHLKNNGYSTGAFVGAYSLHSRFGLGQGFDIYDDDYQRVKFQKLAYGERKAEVVVDNALGWLKNQKSPWFLWIHCFDPHDPYGPPEPFETKYEKNLYDGEVAYVDSVLGNLFNYMKKNNIFDRTLTIFTGDHGESLGQHNEMTHGYFAYNTTLWIPLIISIPGVNKGQVKKIVGHIDIFPTVCDVFRIKKPSFLQGISLLPVIKSKKLPKRTFYFESLYPYYSRGWAPLRGFIYGMEKFIDSPIPELFNLDEDFDELKSLAEEKKLDGYRKRLARIINEQSNPESIKARQRIDRDSLEKLRSLGYISSPQVSRKENFGPEDDVKVLLPYHNKATKAMELYHKGKINKGFSLLKEVITERDDIDIAYTNLAALYKEEGKLKESLEVLKLGLGQIPSSYGIIVTYVQYLVDAGQYGDVIKFLEKMKFRQMEYDPEMWNYLGVAYTRKGDFEKALKAYEKALLLDNEYAVVFRNLGSAYFSLFLKTRDQKDCQKSIQNYKKAIELQPDYASAYNRLGVAYRQTGNLDEAIYSWKKALELRPDVGYPLYNLGFAYMDKGDKTQALSYFSKYKEMHYHSLSSEGKDKLDALIQKCREKT